MAFLIGTLGRAESTRRRADMRSHYQFKEAELQRCAGTSRGESNHLQAGAKAHPEPNPSGDVSPACCLEQEVFSKMLGI